MNFVEAIELYGVLAKQIPCIPGSGAPTTKTEGAVGCLYMNTDNGDIYKCTDVANGSYTWENAFSGGGGGGGSGADGVGIASIVQTTTSTADGGTNVITVTLTNGATSKFYIKNGSKGSAGTKGADGYSPVRGTDYWTPADIAEIKSYVDEAILGGAW